MNKEQIEQLANALCDYKFGNVIDKSYPQYVLDFFVNYKFDIPEMEKQYKILKAINLLESEGYKIKS